MAARVRVDRETRATPGGAGGGERGRGRFNDFMSVEIAGYVLVVSGLQLFAGLVIGHNWVDMF